MNVVYILSSTDLTAGATKSFQALIEGLKGEGVHPLVVVSDREGLYDWLQERGIETFVSTFRPATYTYHRSFSEKLLSPLRQLMRLWCNFLTVRRLTAFLKNRPIDIIHTNVSVIDVGHRVAHRLGIPHIYHFREYGDLDFNIKYFPSTKWFHQHVKQSGDYTLFITRDIQQHHGWLGNARSEVIYNGICHVQQQPSVNELGNYFLYAGRIEPTKGVLPLLHAYAAYSDRVEHPLPLKLVGRCIALAYQMQCKRFVEERNLTSQVEWMGKQNDVTSLYRGARALVVSSLYEGFGRCMPEAMFQGCIVVGHDTGGTKEQFDNGLAQCGQEIGFRYKTEAELVNCLENLHNAEKSDLLPLRKLAFDMVNSHYTIENNVRKTLDFYNRILNENSR